MMKAFAGGMTRGTTLALLVHSVVLTLAGVLLLDTAREFVRHPRGSGVPLWQLHVARAGWAAALGAGLLVTALSGARLLKPFDGPANAGLSRHFKTLFVFEGIVVFLFGGMILDCGETAGRMLLWTLVLNLLVLGTAHRWPGWKDRKEATRP